MLVRLLYVSRALQASPQGMEAIVAQARQHNAAKGVTGILCHHGGIFLQAIEGGRQAINDLYASIVKDPRHQDVVLLHYEEISERRFGSWTMGHVNLSRINQATVLKYSETAELDPYAVSGSVSLALLEDLMATASVCAKN